MCCSDFRFSPERHFFVLTVPRFLRFKKGTCCVCFSFIKKIRVASLLLPLESTQIDGNHINKHETSRGGRPRL